MKEEFVGYIFIGDKRKSSLFELDTDAKTLKVETGSLIGSLFMDMGMLGATLGLAADATAKKIKEPKNFEFDLSNLKKVEFFKYGLTSKAIKLTIGENAIKFTCGRPKQMFNLLQALICEEEK